MIIDRPSFWDDEPDEVVRADEQIVVINLGDDWPIFLRDASLALVKLEELAGEGLEPVASVLILEEKSFERALNLHEKGKLLLASGCVLGPYFIGKQLMPGLRFFRRPEQ